MTCKILFTGSVDPSDEYVLVDSALSPPSGTMQIDITCNSIFLTKFNFL